MIGGSSKMNRLARRRGSDDIEAEEREAIGQRRMGNIDQRNQENPGVKPSSPSRRARGGVKSRTAPSKRPQATGGKSRLYSSNWPSIPEAKSPKETGDNQRSFISISSSWRILERKRRRERSSNLLYILLFISYYYQFLIWIKKIRIIYDVCPCLETCINIIYRTLSLVFFIPS